MECFDVPLAMHALVGSSLVVAGANLMMHVNGVTRGYGAYCFAFGYFLLGLAAAGRDFGSPDFTDRRYLLGVGSAIAVVAGTFMMYYHLQDRVRKMLSGQLPQLSMGIVSAIPIVDHILIYAGYAGLVLSVAMRSDGSFNMVKGGLALGAFVVIGYTKNKMVEAVMEGKNVQKHQIAHILSWLLLVLAIAYSC